MRYFVVFVGLVLVAQVGSSQGWTKEKKGPSARPAQKHAKPGQPKVMAPKLDEPGRVSTPPRQQRNRWHSYNKPMNFPGHPQPQQRVEPPVRPQGPPPELREPGQVLHRGPPPRRVEQGPFPSARPGIPMNPRPGREAPSSQGFPGDNQVPVRVDRDRAQDRDRDHDRDQARRGERVKAAFERTDSLMKPSRDVSRWVNQAQQQTKDYRQIFERRSPMFRAYFDRYGRSRDTYWSFWNNHRFFGGLSYRFNPVISIHLDFYNPIVHWFFVPAYSDVYYRPWYGSSLDEYRELQEPFRYSGLYYPTEELRQLLFDVSGMSIGRQIGFRQAADVVTGRLSRRIIEVADRKIRLGNGDIIVTHYEVLGYENAIIMEGFMHSNRGPFNFKAFLDLRRPRDSGVFVTGSMDRKPTRLEIEALEELNARIYSDEYRD